MGFKCVESNSLLHQRNCPVCGKLFVLPRGYSENYVYAYTEKPSGKKIFLCSWGCYKKIKADRIMSKSKLNAADVYWLQDNGYEVPAERMPKCMKG